MLPRTLLAAALLAAACSVSALADDPPGVGIKAGETVYDRSGGTVGTVASIKGDAVVIDTGTTKVTLGESSLRRRDGKLVLPMTRSVLEAESAKVQAGGDQAVAALMKPGSAFFDSAGAAVGTIVSVEGQSVVIEADGIKARLGLGAFDPGAKGASIRSTRADFLAKLAAQNAAAPPVPAKAGD